METVEATSIRKRIRLLLVVFVVGLAFGCQMVLFVRPELAWLNRILGPGTRTERIWPAMSAWINHLHQGITTTYAEYPFIAYCMDWLVLAQVGFMIIFIGAVIDPVRNLWIIRSGMVICLLHVVTAAVSGGLHGVPFFWQILDASFGVVGVVVLYAAYRYVGYLKKVV